LCVFFLAQDGFEVMNSEQLATLSDVMARLSELRGYL
jgi:hypothetical protein